MFWKRKIKQFEFVCGECGELHSGSPSFSYDKPASFNSVPEDERESRVDTNSDICIIYPLSDSEDQNTVYFIRTILEIPIQGYAKPFTFGVWVSQSEDSFNQYVEGFGTDQSDFKSFAWLTNNFPTYKVDDPSGNLENLACDVIGGAEGQRPTVHLRESEHPLFIDQHNGLTVKKAVKLAQACMH